MTIIKHIWEESRHQICNVLHAPTKCPFNPNHGLLHSFDARESEHLFPLEIILLSISLAWISGEKEQFYKMR